VDVGVETKFEKKLSGHVYFFPNLDKKRNWKGFGGGLEHLNILMFEHLNR